MYAQVRFELNGEFWLEYDTFAVGPKTNNYTLTIGNYSGGNLPDLFYVLNGRNFTVDTHCGTPTMWWHVKFSCSCLNPFITRYSSLVSTTKDGCLKGLPPPISPDFIILDSIEMKVRIKRYPCPHRAD